MVESSNAELSQHRQSQVAVWKTFARRMVPHIVTRSTVLGLTGVAGAVLLWQLVLSVALVDPRLMPAPLAVFQAAVEMAASGELFQHIAASVARALSGLVIGSAIGIAFGIFTGRVAVFGFLMEPIAQLFRSIPAIAFVPLAIIWFGLGEQSKLFLITFGVFFPVWINTLMGVKSIRPVYIRAARSLGVSRRQLLRLVILPAALPYIITGVRISVSIAYIMLAAAEMAGARTGLGQLIQESYLVFRTDRMLVGIIMLGILGLISDRLFMMGVRRLFPWYGAER
ncbi:MAG: ABC transporter permease [Proteobacteria bacterium]|nr:ABC transporter permease [Pseudomonadota bacterium]